jgi:hypothetical protein
MLQARLFDTVSDQRDVAINSKSSSDYRAGVWLDVFYSWVKFLVDVV